MKSARFLPLLVLLLFALLAAAHRWGFRETIATGVGAMLLLTGKTILGLPPGGHVELGLSATNGRVAVAVDDNGPGVAPEEQERIFRPFWSRDDSGTGLGLAIAHELAVALGGRIELATKPGRGSRFELVLPGERKA